MVENESDNGKRRVYVNNNIIRTIFSVLNPVFFGNAASICLRCSVLNGESADVPEDIVVDWLLRYPRSATATPRKPVLVWTILLCIAVGVCSGGHMLYRA